MPLNKLVKVFYCCSDSVQDEQMRQKLENHLKDLERQRVITKWHRGMISPGREWEVEIDTQLKTADIILVLISSDFMACDYHWEVVIKQAMQRHRTRQARVIPILLRPVLNTWKVALDNLTALPEGERAVTCWNPYDNAFANIAQGIKKVAEELTDPTFHIKKYSQQTREVVIPVLKAAGNALIYIIRETFLYLFQPSRTRRHRRVSKIPIRLLVLIAVCGMFIRLFFQQSNLSGISSSNIPESFLSKPNSTLDSTQKVNYTGWIWLGIIKNSSGSLSVGKPLIVKQENIEEYPSIDPPVVPSPGAIVTLKYIVNLRKEKSFASEILNELQRGEKLVILKIEPIAKPTSNSAYIKLRAQVRKCNHTCDK
ncbi:toll/interleukin-1 receptor domain-containing protein [aff. Roholtiella sp. LEGE 12411]|uniref:toll/interleukin-1 receptor domain-containing protein n=1 Tax=aff. Roholtiella sp. LEGE 12411 TaxID=1828822 RepID=UPI001882EB8A|nr:toll/interleukin-1 receptor domain-containing protein [aff. Roholtiella sp. LEGE 12411]MBE9034771.1 toll/interleukin-1 receptor domain-containing protein [aff. Roholtiella sp. LEGE 12411]